jgi:osmoprotectant transport system permease protein
VNYFPPYYAAPIVRINTLEKFPRLREVFRQLSGKISEQEMMDMNYQVDELQRSPRELALSFLEKEGFQTVPKKEGEADLVIGSKAFTENFILAEIFAALIEGETSLVIELRQGFGGTKLLMDAIKNGDVDMYPEYTGTGLLVLLQPPSPVVDSLINSRRKVYEYVREKSEELFGLTWLQPLGFNNTTALMMREEDAASHQIESITDLKEYLQSRKE